MAHLDLECGASRRFARAQRAIAPLHGALHICPSLIASLVRPGRTYRMHQLAVSVDWQGNFDRNKVLDRVVAADEAGIDSAWIPEAWGRDCFTLLTLLADRTKRIRLGTGIVNVFSRTPAALAQHFATLDELSNGRMMAGFGTSGANVIEHFHGVTFEPALTRMRETIEIFDTILRHEPLKYE